MAEPSQPEFRIEVMQVTAFRQNASILWLPSSEEAVFIDPGGEMDFLLSKAEQLGVNIQAIWLTHGHVDHVGAAMAIKDRLGCPIIGPHRDDQFLLEQTEQHSQEYEIPEGRNVEPDRFLDEGDRLELSSLAFEVFHCPGHSPGSLVFFQRESNFAFVGDVLFRGSIGRTDLPRANHEQLINSITQKLWPLGEKVEFLPGHGPGSTFGQERLDNPFVADSVLS